MIDRYLEVLPHGITLSCRAAGARGRPVLMFLHGFPEAAFVWDELLEHFARPEHGGYRCVAPNLRGYERSSQPEDVKAYRAKHLVEDIAALATIEGAPLECLVAHDWGGAVAWSLANQRPQLTKRLAILNSPHPGTFLRDLQSDPKQQAASAYMNFLIRPDAEALLREDGYRRLWGFFTQWGGAPWLTDGLRQQYRDVWDASLTGGLNYYRASPLRPPRPEDPAASTIALPREMLTIDLPTLVLWGMKDVALLPSLVDGLDQYVPDLTLEKVDDASHWIFHEQPQLVADRLERFLAGTGR
ncbi:alpha/beta fold hydrolase [Ramlibacter sp. RBP-2]|uniref:Alpha/beta fold hydrolase n=1 Tax=Ramlibacter lithotrophicus TaxID=2606681 RepID=A0A7X6DG20_9BURK|nr:alpha/beta fold hydrolase [Ramlibacter lithotrophicus]NKE66495.1 alpha/beta fold hydrolase [Ramlibacter lithotrophicus]